MHNLHFPHFHVARRLGLLVTLAVLLGSAGAFAQSSYLRSGEVLYSGQYLVSTDREQSYYAMLKDDGELVVYMIGNGKNFDERRKKQRVIGSTLSGGHPRGTYALVMQGDGNLVIYAQNKSVVWQSGSHSQPPGNYFAVMYSNGNFIVGPGTDMKQNLGSLWSLLGGITAPRAPGSRSSLTAAQRASLSPAQQAAFDAEVMTPEQKAALAEQRQKTDAEARALEKLRQAQTAAAAAAAARQAKANFCPEQPGDNRVVVHGARNDGPATVSTPRLGDDVARTTLRTRNCLKNPIWITVYDLTKTRHLDSGCVSPHSIRDWKSGNYLAGIYFVRAEIMTTSDCKGEKLGDTTIQAEVGAGYLGAAFNIDLLRDQTRGNYYWDNPVKFGRGTLAGIGDVVGDVGQRTGITDAVKTAWDALAGSCHLVAKYMPDPLNASMQLAEQYGPKELQTGARCYNQAVESYYCEFPAELGRAVGSATALPAVGERIWNESKTKECVGFYAATPLMPAAPMFCGMGKMIVGDAQKAIACATAAERAGVVGKFFGGAGGHKFPSDPACQAVGKVAFKVAMKVASGGIKDQAKAAIAAGRGRTAAVVAEEFLSVYEKAGKVGTYDQLTRELETLPACKG